MKFKFFFSITLFFLTTNTWAQQNPKVKEIEQKIKKHDKSVLDDIYSVKARLLDSTFAAILKGSDVEAKLLTLYCVNDLGTLYLPRVRLGLFDLLADKSDAIRMPTLRALNEIVTAADFAKLKNVYLNTSDIYYKRELVLFIGDIKGIDKEELKKMQMDASHPVVKDALLLALAKNGDKISRNKLTMNIKNTTPQKMRDVFDFKLHYLMQDWIVKDLSSLLNKKDTIASTDLLLKDNETKVKENKKIDMSRRTCDLFADYVLDVCYPRNTLVVKTKQLRYTDAQLEEIASFLLAYKPIEY